MSMGVDKAFKYRIYPNAAQRSLIERTFGCCRWVYNQALAMRKEAYSRGEKAPGVYEVMKLIPSWKATVAPWLADVDSIPLRQALRDLDRAYKGFFRSPGKVGFPKFKSRREGRQSYRTNANGRNVRVEGPKHIRLPKLGAVKAKVSRMPEGRILSATVERTPTGKYFAVLHCTGCACADLPETGRAVGIDLGVKCEVVCSDGQIFESPKAYARAQARLAREQRRLARKRRGSANYAKQRRRVALCHERVANQRRDFTDKATTALVRENQAICAEDLNVKGMLMNRRLARAVADAAFGEVLRKLSYKCAWYGRDLVQVDMWYPSSKTCSACGHVQDMPLEERTYRCPECGMVLDRDLNAAKNILAEGLRKLGRGTPEANACGEGVRPVAAQAV